MTPVDYEFLRKLIKRRSGLALSNDKTYLVESRLLSVARKAAVDGISGLVAKLRTGDAEALTVAVVEAMATNETFFFRDRAPFDQLRDIILPNLMAARASCRRIRIWSAACSTGQESYSLAMLLMEMGARLDGWTVEIVASDFSGEAIARARAGLYSQFEVQRGLPVRLLIKYFTQAGDMWELSPSIRAMVKHRQLNLLDDFSRFGTFDVILCRNLLIYLDRDTKADILTRLAQVCDPSGSLILGAAETVIGLSGAWKPGPALRAVFAPNRAEPIRRGIAAIGAARA